MQVHMRGMFGPTRHSAAYWPDQVNAGQPVDSRVINTTSTSGIYGNVGQTRGKLMSGARLNAAISGTDPAGPGMPRRTVLA